jgi:hypothetical protein
MKTRTLATLLFLAVLGCSTVAQADPIRAVTLEYTLHPGAKRCPSEQVFRDTVNGRIRFADPFVDKAPVRLVVTIHYREGRYDGRAELTGLGEPWARDVPRVRDCRDLIHALGIKVAHKLDPREPEPQSPEAKPPPVVPSPPPPPKTEKRVPAGRSYRLRAGLTGNLAMLSAPSVAFEGAADVGLCWSMFCLSGEFRGSPPAGSRFPLSSATGTALTWRPSDGVGVSAWRLAGAIVPCLRWQLSKSRLNPTPFVCAVGQAGAIIVDGSGLEGGRTLPHGALGARLAFELDLFKRLWKRLGTDFVLMGRLGADFLGVANRPVVHFQGQTLWTAPPFSMAFGGGVVASL